MDADIRGHLRRGILRVLIGGLSKEAKRRVMARGSSVAAPSRRDASVASALDAARRRYRSEGPATMAAAKTCGC
jgi:hypothetical protein